MPAIDRLGGGGARLVVVDVEVGFSLVKKTNEVVVVANVLQREGRFVVFRSDGD